MSLSNEERLEEIMYQAHAAGDVEELHKIVREYQMKNTDKSKRLIDFYEIAHFRLKTDRMSK